jgi:hypothetical protein
VALPQARFLVLAASYVVLAVATLAVVWAHQD